MKTGCWLAIGKHEWHLQPVGNKTVSAGRLYSFTLLSIWSVNKWVSIGKYYEWETSNSTIKKLEVNRSECYSKDKETKRCAFMDSNSRSVVPRQRLNHYAKWTNYFTKSSWCHTPTFTFSSKVFCANNFVWYLFETLLVATRFNTEPMGFLIEVNFRKGSKSGTMWSKNEEKSELLTPLLYTRRNSSHFFFQNCNLNAVLFQRAGQGKSYSTNIFVVWTKIGNNLSKTVHFCFSLDFGNSKGPIKTKNCNHFFKIAYWIPELLLSLWNFFMQDSSSKIVQKTAWKCKKTWRFSAFALFLRKLSANVLWI